MDKRKKRAAKFGTPLVEDGLKPAITSRELIKAPTQKALPLAEEVVPAGVELSEAGKHGLIRHAVSFNCSHRSMVIGVCINTARTPHLVGAL